MMAVNISMGLGLGQITCPKSPWRRYCDLSFGLFWLLQFLDSAFLIVSLDIGRYSSHPHPPCHPTPSLLSASSPPSTPSRPFTNPYRTICSTVVISLNTLQKSLIWGEAALIWDRSPRIPSFEQTAVALRQSPCTSEQAPVSG